MKGQQSKTKLSTYGWFWIRLIVIVVASIFIYREIVGIVTHLFPNFQFADHLKEFRQENWILWGLTVLGGILFCWRVVKVFVLHSSPIAFGMQLLDGVNTETGRRGTIVSIEGVNVNSPTEKESKMFWYGAIFRSHRSSEKLMRSRLELLILAFPFKLTFTVVESRWNLRKMDHAERLRIFGKQMTLYGRTKTTTTPDQFRTKALRHLESISKDINAKAWEIDGIIWKTRWSGDGGIVRDYFGNYLEYSLESDNYVVKHETSGVLNERKFEDFSSLREYVKSVLYAKK
ncbi:MAG: hypothetical protein OXH84_00950 [Gammaproteobacteria bacterium]|nr:hypothetical protein [Gammaproteobacteria bacterium]